RRADGLRAEALRPLRRIGRNLLVGRALQYCRALELVIGEMLGAALHRLVASGAEKARNRQALGEVLVVVPAIELLFFVGRNVDPPQHQPGPFLVAHGTLLPRGRIARYPLTPCPTVAPTKAPRVATRASTSRRSPTACTPGWRRPPTRSTATPRSSR